MNPIEDAVREALRARAGSIGVRSIPEGTRPAVRRRNAGLAAGAVVVALTLVVAGAAMFQAIQRQNDMPDSVGVGPGDTIEWPQVRLADPSTAFVPDVSSHPEDVTVLVSGIVESAEFSFVGWTGNDDAARGPCLAFSGPSTPGTEQGSAPSVGVGGMVSEVCEAWSAPALPTEGDLELVGRRDPSTPSLMANFGFVSPRVETVTVSTGNPPEQRDVPLLEGPPGWGGIRAFVFFPPPGMEGTVTAHDAGGRYLARATYCAARPDIADECRAITEPLVLIGSPKEAVPMELPPGWPTVTLWGDVVPYVDHVVDERGELDAGIATPKSVVAYGRADGLPWTLTGFLADGAASSGWAAGPAGEFFLGDGGSRGGSGLGLVDGSLGVASMGFGQSAEGPHAAGLIAYAGIVGPDVAGVTVRFDDGNDWDVDLFPGPEEVEARYFVLFPPIGLNGEILALGEDGSVLEKVSMCASIPQAGSTSSCG